MSETKLVTKIINHLRDNDCYAVKYHVSQYATAGVPDILGCTPFDCTHEVTYGKMFCIEVKRPERWNEVTKAQKYQLEIASKSGAIAGVVTNKEDALHLVSYGWFENAEWHNGVWYCKKPKS